LYNSLLRSGLLQCCIIILHLWSRHTYAHCLLPYLHPNGRVSLKCSTLCEKLNSKDPEPQKIVHTCFSLFYTRWFGVKESENEKITNVLPSRLQHHPHIQTRMQMLQHPKFTLTSDIVKSLFKTKSSDSVWRTKLWPLYICRNPKRWIMSNMETIDLLQKYWELRLVILYINWNGNWEMTQ
jgi:hypothetical protein